NEETVDPGEEFLTSGQDLIFPPGLHVGQVTVVRAGKRNKEIYLAPSGMQHGLTEVLIVLDSIQTGTVPDAPAQSRPIHLLTPPGEPGVAAAAASGAGAAGISAQTDADRITERTKQYGPLGQQGRPAPNFNDPPRNPNPAGGAKPS